MLDWNDLEHAYGDAADIPGLLAQMSPNNEAAVWGELWSRLCHQGTVYSASFAALPILAQVAEQWNPRDRAQILTLAAAIIASDDICGEPGGLMQPVEQVLPRFQRSCRESLAEKGLSRDHFIYLLQAMRSFEGDPFWGRRLDCLVSGEFPGICPHCGTALYVVIGEYGFFVTSEDWVSPSGEPGEIEVRPGVRCTLIKPIEGPLSETEQRLSECAEAAQHHDVARWLGYVCGTGACPLCGHGFQLLDAIRHG